MEKKTPAKTKNAGTVFVVLGTLLVYILSRMMDRLTAYQMLLFTIITALCLGIGAILRD